MTSQELIHAYYDAFNLQDMSQFLSYLSESVVHDINQGHREDGKLAFSAFMDRMNAHYREQIVDIEVCVNGSGNRASAEFRVLGEYLATDDDLPPATGQKYDLPRALFRDPGRTDFSSHELLQPAGLDPPSRRQP